MVIHIRDVMRHVVVRKADALARRQVGGSSEGVAEVADRGTQRGEQTGLVGKAILEGEGGGVA